MGLLKILFITTSIAFMSGELLRLSIWGISIKALDAAVFTFSIAWFMYVVLNRKTGRLVYIPAVGFVLASLASLILNSWILKPEQLLNASLYFIRFLSYLSVITFVLATDIKFKSKLKTLIMIVGGFVVAMGYLQYLFYPNLRNLYYLGWDEHLFRMFSIFLDPNFAGIFFVLYLLFLFDTFIYKSKKIKDLVIYSILSIATFLAIFLTYSRSALLSLIVGIIVYLIFKGKTKFALLIVVGIFLITFFLPRAYETEGTNFLRTASIKARLGSYNQALNIGLDNPVFGVGFNAYKFAKERYGISEKSFYDSHAEAGTDSSLLFVFATTGLVGLATYIYMWYRVGKISKNSPLIISSLIAVIVSSFFVNSLFYSFIMYWMWILIGIRENK